MVPTLAALERLSSSLHPSGHSLTLMSARMPSQIGNLTVAAGPLSFLARSSSGFIRHEVLAVAMIEESKKVVAFFSLVYISRIAAVNAVAAFPLFPV